MEEGKETSQITAEISGFAENEIECNRMSIEDNRIIEVNRIFTFFFNLIAIRLHSTIEVNRTIGFD